MPALLAAVLAAARADSHELPLGFELETILGGLGYPVAVAFEPSGRILYIDKNAGTVRAIEGGVLLPDAVLTVEGVETASEQGLLGLALDPHFAVNGRLYVYYTQADPHRNRVVRYTVQDGGAVEDSVLIDDIVANTIHNGGTLEFAPDGTLLVQTGEAGVCANAQELGSLSGKVLRIDTDGAAPADNPFADTPGARPEVFTFGHRNGFGLAPDRIAPTPLRVYVSENGPGSQDEVNVSLAGRNFGWGVGGVCGNAAGFDEPLFFWTLPTFPRTVAPTGIVRYDGVIYPPDYRGDLFVAHLRAERSRTLIQRLSLNAGGAAVVAEAPFLTYGDGSVTNPIDVAQGPEGAIYFTAFAPSGTLYRIDYPLGRALAGAADKTVGDAVSVIREQAGL